MRPTRNFLSYLKHSLYVENDSKIGSDDHQNNNIYATESSSKTGEIIDYEMGSESFTEL